MEVLSIGNLFARRSIRAYTPQPVEPAHVEMLLKAAMAAPSASNRRPWHFIVVTDARAREALSRELSNTAMVANAPLALVPCGDPALTAPGGPPDIWIQDLAAATENILLAATGLGLGAVWCGVHPVPERVEWVRRVLGIPAEIIPFSLIAVGHPAEKMEPRTQYDPVRVHVDRW
jgi:nitroreductase